MYMEDPDYFRSPEQEHKQDIYDYFKELLANVNYRLVDRAEVEYIFECALNSSDE